MLGPGMGVGITDRVVWWVWLVQWVCQIVGQRLPGSFSHQGSASWPEVIRGFIPDQTLYHFGINAELGCFMSYKDYYA